MPNLTTTSTTLTADGARAELIADRGGLVTRLSLVDRDGAAREILWLPDDFDATGSGWPGGGWPLCFPFAGRVFHEGRPFHYALAGRELGMPLHGFAYGLPWTLAESGPRHAVLTLKDSVKTHELYPFRFELMARYELSRDHLKLTLTVVAKGALTGDAPMPVALGMHPYLKLEPGGGREAARLDVSASEKLRVTPAGGAGRSEPFPADERERAGRLDDPQFANLILGGLGAPRAGLVDERSGVGIGLTWDAATPFRYVVLWTKATEEPGGAGFHCIEPWMGLPDAVHNGFGCRWLETGERLGVTTRLGFTA